MARLYSNENFPLQVVELLRQLGHDVLTIQETGRANQSLSDEGVLKFATSDSRAVVTLNRRHFIRLHQSGIEHGGVIACTFDSDFARQARRIHEAVVGLASLQGQLLKVNRPG